MLHSGSWTVCNKDKEISDVKNVNSLYLLSLPQTLENWPLVLNRLYLFLKFSPFWRKNVSHQVNVCTSSLSWSSCIFFVPWFRACLQGGGGPQIGEVTCGGSPHLSCKCDQIEMRDYVDRRVTPPKRVTSPTWGPLPPCKEALKISKNLLVEKVFLKEKPCFKLSLSTAMKNGYVWYFLILLIRVSFSFTLFSNFRDRRQFRSFHRAILTIWYVYFKRGNNLHSTFLLTIVIINNVVLIIINYCLTP